MGRERREGREGGKIELRELRIESVVREEGVMKLPLMLWTTIPGQHLESLGRVNDRERKKQSEEGGRQRQRVYL